VTSAELAIVTACNEEFADMAGDLIQSLGDWRGYAYVIDIGLTTESRARLSALGATVIGAPDWDPPLAIRDRPGLQAMTLRPRLPEIVDAETIIWIDSDCWVQDTSVLQTLHSYSRAHPTLFFVMGETDAAYPGNRKRFGWTHNRMFYARIHRHLFGWGKAISLWNGPQINSGVISAGRGAPAWGAWQRAVDDLYAHRLTTSSYPHLLHLGEQQALNSVLDTSGAYRLLPAEFNWLCHRSDLTRTRSGVHSKESGRRPLIVHLAVSREHADRYQKSRLRYEPSRPQGTVDKDPVA